MRFVSHTRETVAAALAAGEPVWELDTGSSGNDDVLIGALSDVRADVLTHHDRAEWPERWTLTRVTELPSE